MCLKLGCLSLFWPSSLVCKFGGTPLPVIGETEVKLMDADALPVLVTEDFPNELLKAVMTSASHIDPKKDESYLDLLHQLL